MISIDFHAHIVPSADHGSDSIATSIWQVDEAIKNKIDLIVCTPHFYPHQHNVKSFLKRRDKGFCELQKFTVDKGKKINLLRGAEILICDRLEMLPGLSSLCIENTSTLLIELPFSGLHHEHIECCENLIENGFDVVLAHVDRYSPENIERLIECGAKLQINCDSLGVLFPKKHLLDWIDRGLVVAIGSDIHMKNKKAYRYYSSFRKKHPERFKLICDLSQKYLKG